MSWDEGAPTLDDKRDHEGSDELTLLVFGDGPVRRHVLPRTGSVTIGRARECDIRLSDPLVSRQHAVIRSGAGFTVEDLGSNNGTRVGGVAIDPNQPVRLVVGQVVTIGSALLSLRRAAPTKVTKEAHVVVADPKMEALYAGVDRYAVGDIAVLIEGETGAGKELVAEALHRASPRSDGPYVGINCAALSESLIESELFGHEKGAFTGADQTSPGLLESASGGTVFLDEVGELPLTLQAKMLRVIERKELLRVGGREPVPIDVRFVAATNRDIRDEVASGRFRQDLYFRLAGARIEVPPLRERAAEIEPLARYFLARAAEALGRTPPRLEPEVVDRLRGHSWPGNVRELKNVIDRAVLLGGDVVTSDLVELGAAPARAPVQGAPPSVPEPDDERARIVKALEACGGNQTRAAKMLGISRRTLTNRLNRYNLPRPRK